jgi:hypothetical protein
VRRLHNKANALNRNDVASTGKVMVDVASCANAPLECGSIDGKLHVNLNGCVR